MVDFRTRKKDGQVFPIENGKEYKRDYNKQYVNTAKTDTGEDVDIYVLEPTTAPAKHLKQEDVWGSVAYDTDGTPQLLDNGMIVAKSEEICPVWKDKLPYKSVTAICDEKQEYDTRYWLEFVHGGGSISRRKELPNGKVALRSDYVAW